MKRHIPIPLTLALCLLLLFLLPMQVQAEETTGPIQMPWHTNPRYPDSLTVSASQPVLFASAPVEESGDAPDTLNAPVFLTEAEAAAQIRAHMIARKEAFTIYVKSDIFSYEEVASRLLTQALVHTGDPKAGDYLMCNWAGWGGNVAQDVQDGFYVFQFDFVFQYYTTAAQEAQLNSAVASLLGSLKLNGKSDYEKVQAVYQYITSNITYDEANLSNPDYTLKHTAYAALVNKTAAADGISSLLYRLLLELGIDNRIILGETSVLEHCWNIIKLGNVYYNADATYDILQKDYSFFLRNSVNFLDHYRYMEYDTIQFHTDYPISETDFVPGVEGKPEHIFLWGACGDDAYWGIDRDQNLTIFGNGPTWDFPDTTLPEESGTWRYWQDYIRTITVEEGITHLGNYFFKFMGDITSVQLPDTLETIGTGVFDGCYGLTSIKIPDSVTSLGSYCFNTCRNLKTVTLGSGLKEIGSLAFQWCESLTAIQLPEGLETIGSKAFVATSLKEITIPASVKEADGFTRVGTLKTANLYCEQVASYAFYDSGLETVNFYGDLTTIGVGAFSYCPNLKEVTIPETVTVIDNDAFANCTGMTKAILNNGGTIGSCAFYQCENLSELQLNGPITAIGSQAFGWCASLESITIPASVTKISDFAFFGTLKEVIFLGDAPAISGSTFSGVTATVYYPGNNSTWSEDKLQDYGGELTWISMHTHTLADTPPVYDPAARTHTFACLTCDAGQVEACTFTAATSQASALNQPGILRHTCAVCGGSYDAFFAHRIYGSNRYKTGFAVADALKAQLGMEKFDNIVVASGLGFADALTGSYLAAVKQAPILLFHQSILNQVTDYIAANLSDNGTVYLLGGEVAIPKDMEAALQGQNVVRLAGSNRYKTNLAILAEAGPSDEEVLICNGTSFADSLSASAAGGDHAIGALP